MLFRVMVMQSLTFSELLRQFLEDRDITQDQLAGHLELSPTYVNRWVTGKDKAPNLLRVKQISEFLKLLPDQETELRELAIRERLPEELKFLGTKKDSVITEPLPVYVISYAEAGEGKTFDDSGYPPWAGYDSIPRPPDLKDENSYALKVKGDSMSPAIEEGWIVIVAPNYQVRSKDFVIVKDVAENVRLKKIRFDGEIVQLYSVNSAYAPEIYQKKDLIFIHKVYAIIPR
jgi:phage repressor protein C with HTH and peptisase S24 domain